MADDAAVRPEGGSPAAISENAMDRVGQMLSAEFVQDSQRRKADEERWLEDLLQVQGKYSQEVLDRIDDGSSRAYIRLTASKIRMMLARLLDVMFPSSGEENWGIGPSEKPELEPTTMEALRAKVAEQGGGVFDEKIFRASVLKVAEDRARNMSQLIADQLAEAPDRPGMRETAKKVMNSGLTYGTGVLKGPLVMPSPKWGWRLNDAGMWDWGKGSEQKLPYVEAPSIWDIYPDMDAWTLTQCRCVRQRHIMNSHELSGLAARPDFRGQAILRFMKDNPDGKITQMWFEQELQKAKKDSGNRQLKYRYEVVERWGWLRGRDLMNCGVTVPEGQEEHDFASLVWILGDKVIKCVLSPVRGMIYPYYFWYYNKPENNIFGTGVPDDVRDPASAFNAMIRAALDNAAFAAGPMGAVNVTALESSEDTDKLRFHPKKLFRFTDAEEMTKAINFFSMPIHTTQILALAEHVKSYVDEVTVPAYMGGQAQVSGAAQTMGGLSMLMGSLNIVLSDLVKSYDKTTKDFISMLYNFNMQFSDDPGVKGDFEVTARGTSMLVAKEFQLQHLLQLLQVTESKRFAHLVKDREVLEELVRVMGVGESYLRSEDEARAYQAKELAAQLNAQVEAVVMSMEKRGIDPQTALAGMLRQALAAAQGGGAPQQ